MPDLTGRYRGEDWSTEPDPAAESDEPFGTVVAVSESALRAASGDNDGMTDDMVRVSKAVLHKAIRDAYMDVFGGEDGDSDDEWDAREFTDRVLRRLALNDGTNS